ncbi:MAG: hypothetical protein WCG84_03500 [Candidatus Moraniibacteriota bacterium]
MSVQKILWTPHAEYKMKGYGLSRQRVLRIIRHPERVEEGILDGAVAVMQPVSVKIVEGKKIWRQEIWAMYLVGKKALKGKSGSGLYVVSAWRYPGVSPKRAPIPAEIMREVANMIY